MTHLGLFEGIGGFSLAARWAGWETVAWCEWNEFGQKVLRHHFPDAVGHGDITKTDFKIYANKIDILTGGFPCQPYSTAGKRLGKDDERHLWPEMLRAIREIAPRWVVGENVRGLVNWNGGMVFDEVQADLEACGYEVLAFILPACAKNAPHRRDRVWFVAHSTNGSEGSPRSCGEIKGDRSNNHEQQGSGGPERKLNIGCGEFLRPFENTHKDGWRGNERKEESEVGGFGNIGTGDNEPVPTNNGEARDVADTEKPRSARERIKEQAQIQSYGRSREDIRAGFRDFPTQSPICGGNDGIPRELDAITFPKWRNESIKAYGNAIVPQVVYEIFKAINAYGSI